MIKVKKVIGICRQKPNDKGQVPSRIYYSEEFDEPYNGEVQAGEQVGEIYTTLDTSGLEVGSLFKALYDVGQFWNADKRAFEKRPVLAEIDVVPFPAKKDK